MDRPTDAPVMANAIDLRAPSSDLWATLDVPAGWERVRDLAAAVRVDLAALSEHIVDRIAAEIAPYRDGVDVPRADLEASVFRNIEMMLVGIAERRGPTADEVLVRREVGSRRAGQGMPIGSLIEAYHVAYRELWQALVRELPADDTELATQLLTAATTVWRWVHEVTDAVTDAHLQAMRSREANLIGARQRFTELVVSGDLEADEVVTLATSIGFDPEAQFRVVIGRAQALDGTEARQLQSALDTCEGVHAAVARGPQIIVITQDADAEVVGRVLVETLPTAAYGVGLERDGVAGARTSLGDADRAAGLAAPGDVSTFEDEWLWATLLRAAPRLYEVLAVGADTSVEHPHLAETVLAFADAQFSVSETARRLSVHANTVAYRLERWHALTGWDPRTFPGLTRSLAALRLSTPT